MPTESGASEVPFSISHVLLRVGSMQTLQCNHAGSWSRDGHVITTSHKYTVEPGALVIKNTHKGDTGLYECYIRHGSNDGLVGIKKYNVTSKLLQIVTFAVDIEDYMNRNYLSDAYILSDCPA